MYPILKAALIIAIGLSFYLGARAPVVPPSRRERIAYRAQLFEHVVQPLTAYLRVFCVVVSILYAGSITLPFAPLSMRTNLLPVLCPTPNAELSQLTLRFVAGMATVLAGATLRQWTFRALGPLFTLQVSLCGTHRLITSGPYAYVRHPSYTAAWAMLLGAYAVWTEPSGYVRTCAGHAPWAWLMHAWTLAALSAGGGIGLRSVVEDAALRERFGAEWEAYARRVPWRFVPYLF